MRTRGINVQQILLGLALVAALVWNLAHAGEIRSVRLDSGPTGTRAELGMDRESGFKLISLSNPHRLVVDLPDSRLATGTVLPAAAGVVKSVRSGKPEAGVTRIVFDLEQPVVVLKPRWEAGPQGSRLVIEWPGEEPMDPIARIAASAPPVPQPKAQPEPQVTAPASIAAAGDAAPAVREDPAAASAAATSRLVAQMAQAQAGATKPPAATPSTSVPQLAQARAPAPVVAAPAATSATVASTTPPPAAAPAMQPPAAVATAPVPQPRTPAPAIGTSGRPLVIAIDAGHGGQDPGAVGPTGKREKDITLAIARELARQVNATPGLRAHLVRDRDVFIPLTDRARLARQAKADMFISIHADAAENRKAKGSSVYVLSLRGASSQRARWLAEKENAADLVGGVRAKGNNDSVLTNVLLDLTQSGQMKASEDAGNHILAGLKRIGNNHKPHIERANFAVLRTSDMPSMLVETAFLSNPEEEKRLIDPKFQGTVARAILDGVHTYFSSQPPPGTLYAARAAGERVASIGGSR